MGFCGGSVKCLLYLVNLIFAIAGLAIIAVGAILYTQYKDFDRILDSAVASPPVVLMVIGSVIFLVAFYGCCGASMDSHCMLVTYAVFLILILVAQVAVAVVAWVNGKDTLDFTTKALQKEFNLAPTDAAAFNLFNSLQSQLECCGVNGPLDYGILPGSSLLQSCCDTSSSRTALCTQLTAYRTGCAKSLADFIDDNADIIGGVVIGIAVLEVFGIIGGFVVANYVKKGL